MVQTTNYCFKFMHKRHVCLIDVFESAATQKNFCRLRRAVGTRTPVDGGQLCLQRAAETGRYARSCRLSSVPTKELHTPAVQPGAAANCARAAGEAVGEVRGG